MEYTVTHIYHDDLSHIHDTTVYQLKTIVGEEIIDNQGRSARKFYRYIFDTITQKYKISDLWTVMLDQNRLESVEENQRVIKLVFSPTKYKEWDKNAFNDSSELLQYYSEIHAPYTTSGGLFFDSTLTVEDNITPNKIHFYEKYEIYAKHVGLIKIHYQNYSTGFDDPKPLNGNEWFYELIDYGN